MKTVTLPLNIVSSSLARLPPTLILTHTRAHPAAGGQAESGQSISALTVRLRGALHLHQSARQIGATPVAAAGPTSYVSIMR